MNPTYDQKLEKCSQCPKHAKENEHDEVPFRCPNECCFHNPLKDNEDGDGCSNDESKARV